MTAPDYKHARDIADDVFLAAVDEAIRQRAALESRTFTSAFYSDVTAILGRLPLLPGYRSYEAVPGVPPKVVLAKAKRLIKRGVLNGCDCGCRGDWERVQV